MSELAQSNIQNTRLYIVQKNKGLILTLLCLVSILLAWLFGTVQLVFLEILFYSLAYLSGGFQQAYDGLKTLIFEKDLDVDLLMVVAAIGAACIGYWMDGAILIFIFSLSNTLEGFTMEKTNKDITSIMNLRPEKATLIVENKEQTVSVSQLHKGDLILVRPGERIPADGVIVEGASAIDQSSITGESIPVDKTINDDVFAGTMNRQGALEISVSKLANDTILSKIIHLVQEAESELPPSQIFVEKFERIYARIVVCGALLLMVLPPFLLGWSWDNTIYRAMIFLVVASPCALVASIMPAFLSAISNAARQGLLFKGGIHLENLSRVTTVAFDKTGTLTEGKPKVTDVIPFNRYSNDELISLAGSLEKLSEHPISKAIVQFAEQKKCPLSPAADFQSTMGMGVSGKVNGIACVIGKMDFIHSNLNASQQTAVDQLENQGKTVIFVEADQQLIGIFAIQDTLRGNAKETVAQLKKAGIKTVMLTGDNHSSASAIARQAGVDHVYDQLLPEDKVTIIKKLTEQYGHVAMIGDGVNDAPALATATVGIAMGCAGSDVALETANVVLMGDDLSKIPKAVQLGKRTSRVIKQNVTFAIAVILVLITINFIGDINLPSGVISHESSTILVILSGLRLLR
ncbi:heavy metal translocating P-type ATPase [Sporolactobacillus nakayamae]|uniref:Cd2+/Zn2+-exporting ATPase n=1 Tax=Sporolactobacillus nakayamae TaxID=269670 RepID=A0A1I2V4H4_9BACL|nr:heavy metal translocating P-type ATPase [Sporolactobacillus nakayamae]SFG83933.1 Cd2+/Zn2+-exporting ATPase [Sporolactobacillus nakayamae]